MNLFDTMTVITGASCLYFFACYLIYRMARLSGLEILESLLTTIFISVVQLLVSIIIYIL